MHIHSLIFKELIKRGYSLDGNTRIWNIADSKLWYITPVQAKAYLDLVSSEDYKKRVGPKELTLLRRHLIDIVKEVGTKPVNIIDLGCGNGKKAALFLEEMKNRNIRTKYCPIDISSYMVNEAINEIEKMKEISDTEIIRVQWNISDFENLQNVVPLLKKGDYKLNFFLLLGNTLGNFETHELLYNVRNSMGDGDIILIGNGLNNHKVEDDIVRSCRENPLRDEFFSLILQLAGFKKNQIQYGVRFRNDRLETFYTILSDISLSFQDRTIEFYKGDQIVVAFAYHYEKSEFMSYLKMYFGNVQLHVLEDSSYTLALCKK
ncbi:MAG: L-histidine N(alpha)-methyltransferase [Nanoarchaeota archaeon]